MKIFYSLASSPHFKRTGLPVRLTLASGMVVGALCLGSAGCDEKSDVHAVRAKATKPVATSPAAVDPQVANTVAAAAQAARPMRPAAKDAPPLPVGHGNTLPPGHPPVAGIAAPAGDQVPAGKVHNAAGAVGSVNADGTKAGPSGAVDEVLQAGRYTYLRIGKAWSAVPMAKVQVGQDVAVVGAMKMINFKSKATGRTFPEVWFGNLAVAKGAPVAPQAKKTTADAAMAAIKVSKAAGEHGMTVAEVYAKQAALGGKRVRIQGKVVKFNAEILDRNWLHLQDGTGSAAEKTHDLTITTSSSAKVGDIVVIDGVVVLNRDFGSGYKYAVLVEKATVTPASN